MRASALLPGHGPALGDSVTELADHIEEFIVYAVTPAATSARLRHAAAARRSHDCVARPGLAGCAAMASCAPSSATVSATATTAATSFWSQRRQALSATCSITATSSGSVSAGGDSAISDGIYFIWHACDNGFLLGSGGGLAGGQVVRALGSSSQARLAEQRAERPPSPSAATAASSGSRGHSGAASHRGADRYLGACAGGRRPAAWHSDELRVHIYIYGIVLLHFGERRDESLSHPVRAWHRQHERRALGRPSTCTWVQQLGGPSAAAPLRSITSTAGHVQRLSARTAQRLQPAL